MTHLQRYSLLCLLFSVILVSGCGLRPSETTIYITTSPGNPFQILEQGGQSNGADYVAKGRDLKSGNVIESQRINGWIAMPPDHWTVVKGKLNGVAKYEAEHNISIPPITLGAE